MDAEGTIEDEFYELEVLDGELVEPEVRDLTRTEAGELGRAQPAAVTRIGSPKLQTAAAAATGFVAGAATLALLRRYGAAKLERAAQQAQPKPLDRRSGWPPERGATYLVHIRPLSRPE